MPMFNGVNHLAMPTENMDKTVRFWPTFGYQRSSTIDLSTSVR